MKGPLIGFVKTSADDLEKIESAEKSNYPYVSCNSIDEHLALINNPDCLHFTIQTTADFQLVGHIIINGIKNPNKSIEFRRIVIYNKGKGYGREALMLLKKVVFDVVKGHRLWLDVFDDNARAFTLYESEGFRMDGLLRDSFLASDGTYRSQRIYSVLENEYTEQKNKGR